MSSSNRENTNPFLPQHPFAAQLSGPSGCGKTRWVADLLCHPDSPFDRVFYHYVAWQPLYDQMKKSGIDIKFVEGLPEEPPELDHTKNTAFVFDDLMNETGKCRWVTKLYTAGVHHQNVSVLSLQQKIYTSRDQRLQCHHLVLWDFPQDRGAIDPLARQLCPGKVEEFRSMYRDATDPMYGWFMVDMTKDRDPRLRFRDGWRTCYTQHCNI